MVRDLGGPGMTFDLRYRIDEGESPPHLDLFGFDCEPGPSGMSGVGFHPEEFTKQDTVTYTRVP